eukprot:TRINITY_DN3979_c0_g1_i3.p1 TRINITY_DN3979_c0_g1~~TRINITY_DN3979_c0_g1_i3.p1  ORF type:complete len:211 (+),score=37.09 TRINITY_DN3979_c0_g1_i3:55-687(+)
MRPKAPSASGSENFEEPFDYSLKLVVLGDSGVGKSALLKRAAKGVYEDQYVSTIGVDFEVKTITVDDQKVKLYFWDTAGQERFRTITRSYYRGAGAVLFVFDLTDRDSFRNVQVWYDDVLKTLTTDTLFCLVGNKADIPEKRAVSKQDAEEWANDHGMPFFEASARTSANLDSILENLGSRHIKKMRMQALMQPDTTQLVTPKAPSSSCC